MENDNKGITVSIQIQGVSKQYGTFQALTDIHLDIPKGELVALLGPSGSGKTTLLRIIAGLEEADGGSISFDGEDLTDIHVKNRQVGFVFQHYALFKHMNVFENVAFGLKSKKEKLKTVSRSDRRKGNRIIKARKMDGFAKRYPAQLSGGQRQRIALARHLQSNRKFYYSMNRSVHSMQR